MILGKMFLGSNYSIPLMPTNLQNISIIKLYDGMYDDLYITRNVEEHVTTYIPEVWDDDTIFHAKFNDTTLAGNFGFDMEYASDILVKKRIKGEMEWTTISVFSTLNSDSPGEYNFIGTDFFVRANHDYEYALVAYANGIEGNYDITDITCNFDCISICERDVAYSTIAEIGTCDMTRHGNGVTQELLKSRYPLRYQYGESNYDTGTVSGYWVRSCCDLDDIDYTVIDHMTNLKEFLSDGNAKILKHPDGRIWMIAVNMEDGINDVGEEDILNKRIISFNVTEIGDYSSEKDLYNNLLSNVSQEYCSKNYV